MPQTGCLRRCSELLLGLHVPAATQELHYPCNFTAVMPTFSVLACRRVCERDTTQSTPTSCVSGSAIKKHHYFN